MRFAGLFKALKNSDTLRNVLPNTKNPLDMAIRFGPDAAYAGLSSTVWAPEDASLGDRAMIGLEDALLGVGLSLAGGAAGYKTSKALTRDMKDATQRTGYLQAGMTLGDAAGNLSQAFVPRPAMEAAYAKSALNQQAEQQNIDPRYSGNQKLSALATELGMDPVTLVTLLKNTGQAAAAEQQPAQATTAAVGGMAQALAAGTLRPPMNGSII